MTNKPSHQTSNQVSNDKKKSKSKRDKSKKEESKQEKKAIVISIPDSEPEPEPEQDIRQFRKERCKVLILTKMPSGFKDADIHAVFRKYKSQNGGYQLRWLDPSRAVLIFGDPQVAKIAFLENVDHLQITVRPFADELPKSFHEPQDNETPERQRPETDMGPARRMVRHALGVKQK